MTAGSPPRDCPSDRGPERTILATGSIVWRVHGVHHEPTDFRRTGAVDKRADPRRYGKEGRFDCQSGEYGYLYAGETKKSTIAETFLRGAVVADPSARTLRGSAANERVLSSLRLIKALDLVDLRGAAGLGAVGQTDWLTSCDEGDYHLTQEWATAIRRWAPWAAGLIWQSKRDDVHFAAVLFGDRMGPSALDGRWHRRLDEPIGRSFLRKTLAEFNVDLSS